MAEARWMPTLPRAVWLIRSRAVIWWIKAFGNTCLKPCENRFPTEMHFWDDSCIQDLFWRSQLKSPRIKFYCSVERCIPTNSHYSALYIALINLFSKRKFSMWKSFVQPDKIFTFQNIEIKKIFKIFSIFTNYFRTGLK